MLGSPWKRSHCHDKTNSSSGVVDSSKGIGWKGRMSSTTDSIEREYWMGTEICRFGGYGFQGTVTAGDGSDQEGGEMRAGYVNLREKGTGSRGR